MSNAIIYTRVSTEEQAQKGYSLPHQKSVLELYCHHRSTNILHHFQEDHSAKDFNRPIFKEILRYLKTHRKTVDYFYITRWDRFSRNVEEAYRVIREFREMGIEINAVEQPLDFSQPDSKVMLAVYLVIPEVENDKIGIRTKEGLRRAMKEGCYVSRAPVGYNLTRTPEGKATLCIDEKVGPLIETAFKEYARGVLSSEDIRKKHFGREFRMVKQTMLNIFKNPLYCGKIKIRPWKKEDEMIVSGLHPRIIDDETFDKVQRRLAGMQQKKVHKYSEIDEMLPLRGHLLCKSCGRMLTGSASKGRNGKRHFYYHCQPKCKERFKADEANRVFEELLSEMVVSEDIKTLYQDILNEVFHGEEKGRELRTKHIKEELGKIASRMESIEEKFLDDLIDVSTYNAMKCKTQQKINALQTERKGIRSMQKNVEDYLKLGISFLHGVDSFYVNGTAKMKKQITGSMFPKKLIFLGTKYRTASLDELISTILSKHGRFKRLEIKNPAISGGKSSMAPLLGLEPRTL